MRTNILTISAYIRRDLSHNDLAGSLPEGLTNLTNLLSLCAASSASPVLSLVMTNRAPGFMQRDRQVRDELKDHNMVTLSFFQQTIVLASRPYPLLCSSSILSLNSYIYWWPSRVLCSLLCCSVHSYWAFPHPSPLPLPLSLPSFPTEMFQITVSMAPFLMACPTLQTCVSCERRSVPCSVCSMHVLTSVLSASWLPCLHRFCIDPSSHWLPMTNVPGFQAQCVRVSVQCTPCMRA